MLGLGDAAEAGRRRAACQGFAQRRNRFLLVGVAVQRRDRERNDAFAQHGFIHAEQCRQQVRRNVDNTVLFLKREVFRSRRLTVYPRGLVVDVQQRLALAERDRDFPVGGLYRAAHGGDAFLKREINAVVLVKRGHAGEGDMRPARDCLIRPAAENQAACQVLLGRCAQQLRDLAGRLIVFVCFENHVAALIRGQEFQCPAADVCHRTRRDICIPVLDDGRGGQVDDFFFNGHLRNACRQRRGLFAVAERGNIGCRVPGDLKPDAFRSFLQRYLYAAGAVNEWLDVAFQWITRMVLDAVAVADLERDIIRVCRR